jgi:hypothetical protein
MAMARFARTKRLGFAFALMSSPIGVASISRAEDMKIKIEIGERQVLATLADNDSARAFYNSLPLTLQFDDYAATEKVSYLDEKLPTTGASPGFDPDVGTIAYYAPWGNIAIYYKDFEYSRSLVELGKVTSGLSELTRSKGFTAKLSKDL